MKKITIILAFVAGLACCAIAQTGNDKPMSAEETAMMKKWQDYMTPGDVHAMVAQSNGEWNEDITIWMDPSAPSTKSSGSCTNSMILGGRYQQSMHKGSFNGMPFEGMSIMGYDNIKKTFQSSWVDNFGTGVMTMEGTYNPDTKTVTSKGKQMDAMSGKEMDVREEFTMLDDNHQVMSMYMTPAGGKEFKNMEIKFTRK